MSRDKKEKNFSVDLELEKDTKNFYKFVEPGVSEFSESQIGQRIYVARDKFRKVPKGIRVTVEPIY